MIRVKTKIGDKYSLYTVISEPFRENARSMVMVKCDCGETRKVNVYNLINGRMKSCGCTQKVYDRIKIGDVFGKLTVLAIDDNYVINDKATVKCDCGVITTVQISRLNRGHTKSCGCLQVERMLEANTTHGLSKHPIHKLWDDIKQRCYNPKSPVFHYYGGRPEGSVSMCEEWINDFKKFYDWCISNGWRKGLELDKDILYKQKHGTKTGLLYSPEYCCFVTERENCRVRRSSDIIEYNGVKKTMIEWSEEMGIPRRVLWDRIKRYKWPIEKAMTTPKMHDDYNYDK